MRTTWIVALAASLSLVGATANGASAGQTATSASDPAFSWVTPPLEYHSPHGGSPQGNFLAASALAADGESYEASLWDTTDGSRSPLLETITQGFAMAAAIDGEHVFFTARDDTSQALCQLFVATATSTRRTIDLANCSFIVTGDGNHALVHGFEYNHDPNDPPAWFLVAADGDITSVASDQEAFITVAPNNVDAFVATVDATGAIEVKLVHLDGRPATNVEPPAGFEFGPIYPHPRFLNPFDLDWLHPRFLTGQWTRDSLHVGVPLVNGNSGNARIGVVGADGTATALGPPSSDPASGHARTDGDEAPRFSLNGETIAYTFASNAEDHTFHVASVDGSSDVEVAQLANWLTTTWNAGDDFLYDTQTTNGGTHSLVWVSADGQSTHPVYATNDPPTDEIWGVSWVSADMAYFMGYDSSLPSGGGGGLIGAAIYEVSLAGDAAPRRLIPYSDRINSTSVSGVSLDGSRVSGWAITFLDATGFNNVGIRGWTVTFEETPPPPPPPSIDYVALGDSFASGEGTYNYDGGNKCHRGPLAWPRVLQQEASSIPVIMHRACSGAQTGDLFKKFKGSPRQIPITPDPSIELVTATIGGNDVLFSGIVKDCYFTSCGNLPDRGFRRKVSRLGTTLVTSVYPALRRAYPNARIVHVGYPRITPPAGDPVLNCGWLRPDEQAAADGVLEFLNSEIASAALISQQGGDNIEYANVTGALADHELCTPDSWVHPINPLVYGKASEQAHPTAPGQVAYMRAVATALDINLRAP
jgi:hypothetical protein